MLSFDAIPQTSNTERSVQRRYDEEFIKSYAREYYKRRTEIMALVVLQAKARGKVARLTYAADRSVLVSFFRAW